MPLDWIYFGKLVFLYLFLGYSSFLRYAFLSDYLTDLYTGKSKINFVKNNPRWRLNPLPLDHDSNTLPTELSHYFVVCVSQ